jgi:HK97 family phage portal protein
MGIFKSIRKALGDINERYTLSNSLNDINFNNRKANDFLDYNETCMYINKAIERRSDKVGEVEFVLKDEKGEVIEDDQSGWLDLLNKPNSIYTGKQFWKLYQKYMDLCGCAFIYKTKDTNVEIFDPKTKMELHLLRPDYVEIQWKKDGTGVVDKYIYQTGANRTEYEPDQVMYSFNPDPKNPLFGLSLLMAGVRTIETEIQLSEYQTKILKNGGRVEGVFKFKNILNKQQLKELKDSYEVEYAGAQKAGRPLFLGGESDYANTGLTPTELSYLKSKEVSLNDICILTGVPVEILGTTQGATYANADASIAIFLRETIKPLLQDLVNFLDWRLLPDNLWLDFVDPTPENQDKQLKMIETANTVYAATINEKREMLGLDKSDVPEADDILIPFSLSPLGAEKPAPADPNLPPQKEQKGNSFNNPLRDITFRKKYAEIAVKRMDRREMYFKKKIMSYFKGQEERIMDYLPTKGMTKTFIDEIFNHSTEIRLAKSTVIPLIKQVLIEAGQESFDLTNSRFEFNYTSVMDKWVDTRANLFADEITATTFSKLKNQFTEAFANNENRSELIKRIQNVYDGFTEGRSKTIARTEVHGATIQGTIDGFKQSGVQTKIWVAVMDDVTRDSHAMVDGEEVPLNMYFSNGMYAPGTSGDPGEDINCRCVI